MWASIKRIWTIDDPQSVGASLVLKPAMEGLRILGKEIREFTLDRTAPNLMERARNDLQSFQPDAIFLANHPSSVLLHPMGLNRISCPVFVWLFDDPALMGSESFADNEVVLVADPRFEGGARKRNAKTVLFLPVAAPDRVEAPYREEYAFPIAYVGSILVNQQARDNIPPAMRDYFQRIVARKVEEPYKTFNDLFVELPYQPGKQVSLSGPLNYYLYSEANRVYRMRFLQSLAPHGLKLFGNERWTQEIQGTNLQDCFAGRLDPFFEYPSLIRSTQITVNLRSLQGFTAPTHRDFLAPRLGAFMISSAVQLESLKRGNDDSNDPYHLNDFQWSHSYRTPEEMAEGAAHFLHDESARRDWTENASKCIEERHTYSHRMNQLGDILDRLKMM